MEAALSKADGISTALNRRVKEFFQGCSDDVACYLDWDMEIEIKDCRKSGTIKLKSAIITAETDSGVFPLFDSDFDFVKGRCWESVQELITASGVDSLPPSSPPSCDDADENPQQRKSSNKRKCSELESEEEDTEGEIQTKVIKEVHSSPESLNAANSNKKSPPSTKLTFSGKKQNNNLKQSVLPFPIATTNAARTPSPAQSIRDKIFLGSYPAFSSNKPVNGKTDAISEKHQQQEDVKRRSLKDLQQDVMNIGNSTKDKSTGNNSTRTTETVIIKNKFHDYIESATTDEYEIPREVEEDGDEGEEASNMVADEVYMKQIQESLKLVSPLLDGLTAQHIKLEHLNLEMKKTREATAKQLHEFALKVFVEDAKKVPVEKFNIEKYFTALGKCIGTSL
jgi:hypothetical protein